MLKRFTEPTIFEEQVEFAVLPREYVQKFRRGDVTPDVRNIEHWRADNTVATTITDFKFSSEGQRLHILGDGFTTIAHNTRIKTNTAANKLLAVDSVYRFTVYDGVWYEDADVSGGGGAPSAHAASHQNNGSDEINVAGLSGLLADAQTPLAHTHVTADITNFNTSGDARWGQLAASNTWSQQQNWDAAVNKQRVNGGRFQVGTDTGGMGGTFGSKVNTDAAGLQYSTYWAYDSYWDEGADSWNALRTTLGRKWVAEMGYHLDNFRIRRYDGVVTAPWTDAAWTTLLTLNNSGGLTVTDITGTVLTASQPNINRLAATVGIGVGAATNAGLHLRPSTLTGATEYGAFIGATYDVTATTIKALHLTMTTAAAVHTVVNAYHAYISESILGAGSSITNQYGLYIESLAVAGTNYSIWTGTAPVRFGGSLTVVGSIIGNSYLDLNTNAALINTPGVARIQKATAHGLWLQAVAGTTNDFAIANPAGTNILIRNPTGTSQIEFPSGSVSMLGALNVVGAITQNSTQVSLVGHTHAAADITSGTINTARLGSGTADATKYLRGDSTWQVPPGGGSGANITEVEVDFGSLSKCEAEVVVTDALVSPTSKIIAFPSGVAATGLEADEAEFWTAMINAVPETGQIRFHFFEPNGWNNLQGKKKINYLVS